MKTTPHKAQLRLRLAKEAARLMYEEGVKQYMDAKQMAARRLLGQQGKRRLQFRPSQLPSNGEIQQALLELARLREGSDRQDRLFVMRVMALEAMHSLEAFEPRLIGSVSTGHVRRGSDIDLHVFTDDLGVLEQHMEGLGWDFEMSVVTIRSGTGFEDYHHAHVAGAFELELSVYPTAQRRVVQRSSTDGKPIVRLKARAVESLLEEEHSALWATYRRTGQLPQLDDGMLLGCGVTMAQVEEDGQMVPWRW